jgi:hypothetical protein
MGDKSKRKLPEAQNREQLGLSSSANDDAIAASNEVLALAEKTIMDNKDPAKTHPDASERGINGQMRTTGITTENSASKPDAAQPATEQQNMPEASAVTTMKKTPEQKLGETESKLLALLPQDDQEFVKLICEKAAFYENSPSRQHSKNGAEIIKNQFLLGINLLREQPENLIQKLAILDYLFFDDEEAPKNIFTGHINEHTNELIKKVVNAYLKINTLNREELSELFLLSDLANSSLLQAREILGELRDIISKKIYEVNGLAQDSKTFYHQAVKEAVSQTIDQLLKELPKEGKREIAASVSISAYKDITDGLKDEKLKILLSRFVESIMSNYRSIINGYDEYIINRSSVYAFFIQLDYIVCACFRLDLTDDQVELLEAWKSMIEKSLTKFSNLEHTPENFYLYRISSVFGIRVFGWLAPETRKELTEWALQTKVQGTMFGRDDITGGDLITHAIISSEGDIDKFTGILDNEIKNARDIENSAKQAISGIKR